MQGGEEHHVSEVNSPKAQSYETLPVDAFVLDVKGLIADLSLKGAKITKLNN